jgi:hypothetical protein
MTTRKQRIAMDKDADIRQSESKRTNAHIGQQVFWFRTGEELENCIPDIGFVSCVHVDGVVDLVTLPRQDGVCEYRPNAIRLGSPMHRDKDGEVSWIAKERGCWKPFTGPSSPVVTFDPVRDLKIKGGS